jgi:soluble lytic murein transglycosylase
LTLPGTDVPLSKKKAASNAVSNADVSDTMRFLLGFFENDAAQFAPQYIRAEESGLSSGELCRLAEALGAAGQYQESIRLVSLYAGRNDYQIKRQDLELLYPRPFREPVERYAEELGIKPSLLYGLIRTESAFNSDIVSRAGAVGLTQLMPATAREMAARIHRRGGPDYIVEDFPSHLHDPAVNIHIGASYLAYLNERMEDPLLALLAYNGGMGRVRRWYRTANLPPDLFLETVEYSETRNYGRSVIGAAAMYEALYGNP